MCTLFQKNNLTEEYNLALCHSAVLKAYLGDKEEAITQIRHVKILSADTTISNFAKECILLLQSNQLPEINIQTSADVSELYNAVAKIKYELYRKPLMIKIIIIMIAVLLGSFVIYAVHSGMLQHLHELRIEKKHHQEKLEEEMSRYCTFLNEHPEEIKYVLQWNDYAKMCAVVNMRMGDLIEKLEQQILMNETEVRLCVLAFLGLPRNVIADILPYAPNSVGKLKNTVSKKLNTNGKNLHFLLWEMAILPNKKRAE